MAISVFIRTLVACVISLLLSQCEASKNAKAKVFGSPELQELAVGVGSHYFVMFYAPWCGHCKRMQTLWDVYADENQKSGESTTVAKVDCTKHTPLCATENIRAYPTLKLFLGNKKFTYRGSRKTEEFKKFVESHKKGDFQPDYSTHGDIDFPQTEAVQLTEKTFEKEVENDLTFVDFFAPWCPHCRELTPIWNELAHKYRYNPRVTIAKVDCTSDPQLCQKLQIRAYPTLVMFKKGTKVDNYNNHRRVSFMEEFVERHLSSLGPSKEREDDAKDNEGEEASEQPEEPDWNDYPPLSLYDQKMLLKNEELWFTTKTFYQLSAVLPVVIYFHSLKDEGSQSQLMQFKAFSQELKVLRDASPDQLFAVAGMVDCLRHEDLCNDFQIRSYPKIMYSIHKQYFVEFTEKIMKDKLLDFIRKYYEPPRTYKRDEL